MYKQIMVPSLPSATDNNIRIAVIGKMYHREFGKSRLKICRHLKTLTARVSLKDFFVRLCVTLTAADCEWQTVCGLSTLCQSSRESETQKNDLGTESSKK